MRKQLFGFLIILLNSVISTQANNYQMFDNYHLSIGANSIRFFIQDSLGVLWVGTNKGLYSFDGYTAYPHKSSGNKTNSTINCGASYGKDHLLLGSEYGLILFNIKTDQFEDLLPRFQHDVRSLLKTENNIWIGCTDGLFLYNITSGVVTELYANNELKTKHNMTYALLEDDGYVYLGSNRKLGRFTIHTKKYEILDANEIGGNFLLNSLLKDPIRNCIWVGQGGSLLKYKPNSGKLRSVGEFYVVKSMALDNEGNLIMGTDNGLCVYNNGKTSIKIHDSREPESLANNVVWKVFQDKAENIWLGTDNGISLSPKHRRFSYIPIFGLTGNGEGNQFYSIYRDSYNNYWLGGSNGLIVCQNINRDNNNTRWYKMGGSKYLISHNHVRDIFEDKDRNLWVATDYGLNLLNRQTQAFSRRSVYAPDSSKNANWAYDILEDNYNRLWIASYNGGVFVIDKKKLLLGNDMLTADILYSTKNGLSGNNVDFIVFDKNENVWALIHNKAINIINGMTGEISIFPIKQHTGGVIPNILMSDTRGNIWMGYPNGVAKIDPATKKVQTINLKGNTNVDILAIEEVNNSIWISTNDGIRIIDKNDLTTEHLNRVNHVFTDMYFDETKNKVLLGGIDAIALSEPHPQNYTEQERIIISAIYVNNQFYINKEHQPSVRYINEIKLAHNQNNLKIEFSDLTYSKGNKGMFKYKINEANNWNILPSGENSIKLDKLKTGTYNLFISSIPAQNESPKTIKKFSIIITPPWYGTFLAQLIYFILISLFIWWVYFLITAKNRMKFEQLEKEKTLEQSSLKTSFFSDVAHEFKTPLSLIIAPLDRLIQASKNEKDRNALEMVHQNAMKLNSLIHQAIDYYRDDSKVNVGLLLSKVELVEFARSIFLTYKEGMRDKQIEFVFNTNIDKVFLNIDTVKIESVFNNLLSNACKFTNAGDSIILSLNYNVQENGVEIKVSDSGVGIPKKDIPYIFQRFFQSSTNSNENEGTGIGLFLVKNYIELHGGNVKAYSKLGEGTTINAWLPVIMPEIDESKDNKEAKNDNADKQLIAIVEDNMAIAEFIYNMFTPEYRCILAHNGKTGLKACIELKPDIIITDVMMPVMDGLEMARHLKNNSITTTIPLVLLTAKDDKETELKSIQLNIEAFIAKPFDSTILHSRVKQILDNRKLLEKKARIEHIASPKTEKAESLDEKFLAKITKIIEDEIANPELNVNMLCELAEISPKQLYRKIKQLAGITAVEYIRSIRMKKAAMFLSNKNFTIAEVMYMVGFSNHSYFAKCFQAKFGKTPRQYIEYQKNKAKE